MTDTTRIIDEIERLRNVVSKCAAALGNGASVSPSCSVEFMEEVPKEISLVVAALTARAEAAEAKITAQAEQIERLNELTSCSVTVGRGLSVYGTIEAVGRVQTYILLDSNHPVEKADVRRTLARELRAAEARARELEGAYDMVANWIVEGTEDLPGDTPVTIKIGDRSTIFDELKNLRAILTGEQQ